MQISSYQSNSPPVSADFDVVCVELAQSPDKNPLSSAVNIGSIPNFWQFGRRPEHDQYVPNIKLGSLVVTLYNGQCTHAGIISEVSENKKRPGCIFDAWPLEDKVRFQPFRLHPLSGRKQRVLWVSCKGKAEKTPPLCRIAILGNIAGKQLLELIGPVAPAKISTVFWGEAERQAFDEKAAIQDQYVDAANTLLQRLVS